MIEALDRQTRHPDQLVIVDNGSDPAVRVLADTYGASYLDPGENLGPAGGFTLAMRHVLESAGPDDWLLLLDDDDPPRLDDALETLWNYAQDVVSRGPRVGAVGLHGGDYDYRRGTFRRFEDDELNGDTDVCIITGGAHPMYSCSALRDVGVFDDSLFFGFEEGEFGLRLRDRGYRLLVPGAEALRWRSALGQLGRRSIDVKTATSKAPWQRYNSIRNSTILARRYAHTAWAPAYVALGVAVKGVVSMVRSGQPVSQ